MPPNSSTSAPEGGRRLLTLTLEAVGLLLLSVSGWFGGHLVFHHGIGRHTEEPSSSVPPQA